MLTNILQQINWIDWVIVLVVIYHVHDGWERGMVSLVNELFGFFGSLWMAVKFYPAVGVFIAEKFGIASGWSKLLGFVGVAVVSEMVMSALLDEFYKRLPKSWINSRVSRWLLVFLSAINGLIVASFLLLVILGLPIKGTVKADIRSSKIGGALVKRVQSVEKNTKSIFEEVVGETVKFVTVRPSSKERVSLGYEVTDKELTIDSASEGKMLELLNSERVKIGLKPLVVDAKIVEVARKHSRDMWLRGYFSHINPQGQDPFQRMREGGVKFNTAGENLALAPEVNAAHTGLMNSEGHKRNILDPNFKRVGIGIIDGGWYGKMFTQDFAD